MLIDDRVVDLWVNSHFLLIFRTLNVNDIRKSIIFYKVYKLFLMLWNHVSILIMANEQDCIEIAFINFND